VRFSSYIRLDENNKLAFEYGNDKKYEFKVKANTLFLNDEK